MLIGKVSARNFSRYDELRIAFFNGPDTSVVEFFSTISIDKIVNHKSFNQSRMTVFYIHGFNENVTSLSVQTVVSAFIHRKSHNILVLDWSDYATGNYVTQAVPNLMRVSLFSRCSVQTKTFR